MAARAARFEVVRSDAGWFARFRAANGQIQWATESYTRRRAAVAAVESLALTFGPTRPVEVRTVDERTEATR